MEFRRLFFLSIVFFSLNFCAEKICAQERKSKTAVYEKNYHVVIDENLNPKVIQKLSWQKIPNIENYKIEIQKKDGENFLDVIELETSENFVEVSLEAGEYRFRVSVKNFFEKEIKSEWKNFEILKAFVPQIFSVAPQMIFLDSKKEKGIVSVEGKNFLETTIFKLQKNQDSNEKNAPKEIVGEILNLDAERGTAKIQFDLKELEKGVYKFSALNAGGFSADYEWIAITNLKEKDDVVFPPRTTQKKTAKSDDEKKYYITVDEDKKISVIQKLSWNEIPDIKNYKVVIQKKDGGNYDTVLEKDLNENFVEVSLEAGEYRFQVAATNFFDYEKKSEWKYFEVLKAVIPQINSVEPQKISLKNKQETQVLTINGENLLETTVFKLQKNNSDEEIYGKILSVDEKNQTAQVQFKMEDLEKGEYELFALNPGDFCDEYNSVSVEKKSNFTKYFQLSLGYDFPIMFYDGTLEKYVDSKIFPISGIFKISFLGELKNAGAFGAGLNANYFRISADNSFYKFSGNYLNVLLNFIYQRFIIPEKLCFDIHAGAGAAFLFGAKFEYNSVDFTSPNLNALGLAFGGGFVVQYYPLKRLYVEAGADFVHAKFKDMSCGFLNPEISVGVKF